MLRISTSSLAAAAVFLCLPASAGLVELGLNVDTVSKTWEVTAEITDTSISFETGIADPGDEILGLAGFFFDVVTTGGLAITPPLSVDAPAGVDLAGSFTTTGFTEFISTGSIVGSNLIGVSGGQDTTNGADPRVVLEGPGLSAGSDGSSAVEAVWGFPLVLASGSYTGEVGTISAVPSSPDTVLGNLSFSLLYGDPTAGTGGFDDPAHVEFAAGVSPAIVAIPEPTMIFWGSLGLVVAGGSLRRRVAR